MTSWIWTTLALILTAFFLLYKYFTRNFDYWKKRNVFYIQPTPFVGNFGKVVAAKVNPAILFSEFYRMTDKPYLGIFVFDRPVLIVRDPKLAKTILQKDFNFFVNRSVGSVDYHPIAGNVMFVTRNPKWKVIRQKSTPAFTPGKLKRMLPLINEVGESLQKYLNLKNGEPLEAKEVAAKYSTDIIAKCAFGVDAGSFEDEDAPFRKVSRHMFDFRITTALKQMTILFFPKLAHYLKIQPFDTWIIDFLQKSWRSVIKDREQKNFRREDLIDILNDARQNENTRDIIDEDTMLGIALAFFGAGFETTGSTISWFLYEVCMNTVYQDKLREEILETLKQTDEELSYDVVTKMKYLDMCVCEVLRMYPTVPYIDRECIVDYKIPGHDLTLEKGTAVFVPLPGLHYDERFFPNPTKFDPERFADKSRINQEGFYYMPFGEGPRGCIGERFAMLSVKLCIIKVLSKFEIQKTEKTPTSIEFEPKSFMLQSRVGLMLKLKPLKTN